MCLVMCCSVCVVMVWVLVIGGLYGDSDGL